MLLSPRHALLLDEPTNHLDLGAREVLVEALGQFEGAVVFSSHDRWLLRAVATHALVWPGPVLRDLEEEDAWDRVFQHMDQVSPGGTVASRPVQEPAREQLPKVRFNAFRHARAVAEVEAALATVEAGLAACLARLGVPGPDAGEAAHDMARLEGEQAALEARWLALAEEAEAAGQPPA
jgi:ATP-binding cassette subfamily F protein 3